MSQWRLFVALVTVSLVRVGERERVARAEADRHAQREALVEALRVADVFGALVEASPYKPALPADQAIARMREQESRLEPRCREALERVVDATAHGS